MDYIHSSVQVFLVPSHNIMIENKRINIVFWENQKYVLLSIPGELN